jgi:hypothetical protein
MLPPMRVFMVDLMSMADFDVRKGLSSMVLCILRCQSGSARHSQRVFGQARRRAPSGRRRCGEHRFSHRHSRGSSLPRSLFVAAQMLRACVEGLPTKHPLRRAMQPFLMRTALINNTAAYSLLEDNSVIEHMTASPKTLCTCWLMRPTERVRNGKLFPSTWLPKVLRFRS